MQSRVVMLVDLDYFFAQSEELRNPSLRGKPVVIGMYSGRTAESGAVSTANYAARTFGIKSGMPLFQAKRRLEGHDSIFLPVDYDYYEKISDKLMLIFRGYADLFEQVGIDEAYLDVTSRVHGSFDEAMGIGRHMKIEVMKKVGVTFSLGIAPNKLLAKIACDEQKPDGMTIVRPPDAKSFLEHLPVDRLLGVGKKTSARMAKLGIKTIRDLANFDVQRLVEVFGKTLGVYFQEAANGRDELPVQESGEPESISRIATLKQNSRDLTFIAVTTDMLCGDVRADLAKRGLLFKQVGIVAFLEDLSVRSRSATLDNPTESLEVLKDTVRQLLERLLDGTDKNVRRIGVKVSMFKGEENVQRRLESYFG